MGRIYILANWRQQNGSGKRTTTEGDRSGEVDDGIGTEGQHRKDGADNISQIQHQYRAN